MFYYNFYIIYSKNYNFHTEVLDPNRKDQLKILADSGFAPKNWEFYLPLLKEEKINIKG